MTTPNIEELITYLCSFFIDENVSAIKANKIANALQSQAERIATLEAENTNLKAYAKHERSLGAEPFAIENNDLRQERDTLRAQLAEIEATEPVAVVLHHEGELIIDASLHFFDTHPIGTKLFTRPMPAQGVKDAERYRWLRDYLISPSTHFDDLIVSADKADTLDGVIDAAITQAGKGRTK